VPFNNQPGNGDDIMEAFVLVKDIDEIFQKEYDKMKQKLIKNETNYHTYKTRVFFYESIYAKLEKIKAKIHRSQVFE